MTQISLKNESKQEISASHGLQTHRMWICLLTKKIMSVRVILALMMMMMHLTNISIIITLLSSFSLEGYIDFIDNFNCDLSHISL
jgi:hypothetical protein